MRAVRLDQIAEEIDYGVTASASDLEIGPKFLRITDIQEGLVDWNTVPYCEADSKKLASARLQPGDIVFARTGATTGKSFLIDDCPDKAVFASYLIRVRPGPEVSASYLAHFFKSSGYWSQISLKTAGAAQPGVNASKLKELNIPLPPLEEQRRIAGILDQAAALRRLRTCALDKLSTLGQAIFHEMFGDPATNPKGWPMGVIGDLLSEAKYGSSGKANSEGRGLPMLRMGNVTYDGRIDLSDLKHIELSDKEFEKYTTRPGDLLFNRTNSKELVGKTAVVTQSEHMAIAGYLVRGRANARGNTHYISGYLNSPHGKAVLRNMCKNIVGMANINAKEFQSIQIAIPPVELQRTYADKLVSLRAEETQFQASLTIVSTLFASLQHRAFKGEL